MECGEQLLDYLCKFEDYINDKRINLPFFYKSKNIKSQPCIDVTDLVRKAFKWIFDYTIKMDPIYNPIFPTKSEIYDKFIEETIYKDGKTYPPGRNLDDDGDRRIILIVGYWVDGMCSLNKEDVTEWFSYIFDDLCDYIKENIIHNYDNITTRIISECNSVHKLKVF